MALIVLSLLALVAPEARAICADYRIHIPVGGDARGEIEPAFIGSVPLPFFAARVAVQGSYAYVACDVSGLQVVDMSDPFQPILVDSLPLPGETLDVAVQGDAAFAMNGETVYAIVLDEPAHPHLLGAVTLPFDLQRIELYGGFLYVVDVYGALRIIDVADPANMRVAGAIDLDAYSPHDVAVRGTYAYLAGAAGLLVTIDVADPANPAIVGEVTVTGAVGSVTAAGSRLYLCCGGGRMCIVDLADPEIPVQTGCVDTESTVTEGVAVMGSFAYLADAEMGMEIVDVSNPAHPEILTDLATSHWATSVSMNESVVCVVAQTELLTAPFQCEFSAVSSEDPPAMRILSPPFPLPSRGDLSIRLDLPRGGAVRMAILNAGGRTVRSWPARVIAGGPARLGWDGTDNRGEAVGSGVYFVRISWEDHAETARLVVIR